MLTSEGGPLCGDRKGVVYFLFFLSLITAPNLPFLFSPRKSKPICFTGHFIRKISVIMTGLHALMLGMLRSDIAHPHCKSLRCWWEKERSKKMTYCDTHFQAKFSVEIRGEFQLKALAQWWWCWWYLVSLYSTFHQQLLWCFPEEVSVISLILQDRETETEKAGQWRFSESWSNVLSTSQSCFLY